MRIIIAISAIALSASGAALAQTAMTTTKSATTTTASTTKASTEKPRTAASLQCSKDADAKSLHGKPRKAFMSSCKKAAK